MVSFWLTGAVLLCLSPSSLAIEYTFRKVLDYTGRYVQVYGPSLNDNGAMAFTAFLGNGTYGAYAITEDGDPVTIADSSGGYSMDLNGRPSINNSNTIAFAASTPNYPFHGIYRSFSFEAPEIFQQVSDLPGGIQGLQHPWISDSNGIVYVASIRPSEEIPSGLTALMRGSLPVVTGPPATTSFSSPDINSMDSVVTVGSEYIYINTNNAYHSSGSSASINDHGTIAFFSNGNHYAPFQPAIYTGDGISAPTLYASATGGTSMGHPDINNDGLIAYVDREGSGNMIYVGSGHERIMNSNRLFGSFISSDFFGIQFYRGLNNHGQIAFSYTLGNGEKGIALATPRDPTMLGNGDFNNGLGLFEVIDEGSDGFAFTPNVAGDPRVQMTTENGVLGLRQGMDTNGEAYLLQFDFDWLTTAGTLEVVVNDVPALSIGADGSATSTVGLPVVQPMGDLTHLSLQFLPADFNDPPGGYIRFDLHPGSEATIQLDNISFAPVIETTLPGDYNGDGTVDAADYVVWRKNGGTSQAYNTWRANFGATADGAAAVARSGATGSASAAVPEPGMYVFVCASLTICTSLRRRRASRK